MKPGSILFAVWLVTMTACVSTNNEETPDKYGFLAKDDAELLQRARDPDIAEIILGCVYDLQMPTKERRLDYISSVTVVDVFKGKLSKDQKIKVVIYAEGGPSPEMEIGRLKYYFLREIEDEPSAPENLYWCEWTDTVAFVQYGDEIGRILRNGQKRKWPFLNHKGYGVGSGKKAKANDPSADDAEAIANAIEYRITKDEPDIYAVAIKFGVSPYLLREANHLKSNELILGQVLKIPVYK
jgi:LysM domain